LSRITFHASLWREYACCEGQEPEERRGGRARVVRRGVWSAAQQGPDLFGGEVLYGKSARRYVRDQDSRRRQGLGEKAVETEGHGPRAHRQPAEPALERRGKRARASASRLVLQHSEKDAPRGDKVSSFRAAERRRVGYSRELRVAVAQDQRTDDDPRRAGAQWTDAGGRLDQVRQPRVVVAQLARRYLDSAERRERLQPSHSRAGCAHQRSGGPVG